MISKIKNELQEKIVKIIKSNTDITGIFDYDRTQKFIKEINDHLNIIIQRMLYCLCFKIKRSNNVHYSSLCIYFYKRIDFPPSFWENGRVEWDLLSPNANEETTIKLEKFQLDNLSIFERFELINLSIFEFDYNALVDYNSLKVRCGIYKEELIMMTMSPSRIQQYLDNGFDIEELDDII